jgi:hypothetical protein
MGLLNQKTQSAEPFFIDLHQALEIIPTYNMGIGMKMHEMMPSLVHYR